MIKHVHKKHLWKVTYRKYFASCQQSQPTEVHLTYVLTELDSIEDVIKNLKAGLDCQHHLSLEPLVKVEYLGKIYNTYLTEQEGYDP